MPSANGTVRGKDWVDPAFSGLRNMRVNPSDTVGVGGTAIFGGFVQTVEKDSRLSGQTRFKTFSENLVNSAIVGAGTRLFLNLLAKSAWTVSPADESAQAQEYADWVYKQLHEMATPWPKAVKRIGMYRYNGFGLHEWTAQRQADGTIGLHDLEARPAMTIEGWDVDGTGAVRGVTQRSPQDGSLRYIPRSKLLYLVDDSLNDSPEGLGLFRHLAKPVLRMERYEQLEGWGFETDLRGIPIGKAPLAELENMVQKKQITAAQKTAILQPIRDFLEGHVRSQDLSLLTDSATYQNVDGSSISTVPLWGIDLLRGDDPSLEEVGAAITREEWRAARILGVEHLLLGGDKGTQALSRDKTQVLAANVDGCLREIGHALRNDIVRPLFLMNGWPEELLPELATETVQWRDVEQVSSVLRDIATAGAPMTPIDPAVAEVYGLVGLTPPDPEEVMALMEEQRKAQAEAMAAQAPEAEDEDVPEDPEQEQTETQDEE